MACLNTKHLSYKRHLTANVAPRMQTPVDANVPSLASSFSYFLICCVSCEVRYSRYIRTNTPDKAVVSDAQTSGVSLMPMRML